MPSKIAQDFRTQILEKIKKFKQKDLVWIQCVRLKKKYERAFKRLAGYNDQIFFELMEDFLDKNNDPLKKELVRFFLEKKLDRSVRRGISVGVQGLHCRSASDHLPILLSYKPPDQASIDMVSWNLLAEEHLGNFYKSTKIFHKIKIDEGIPDENCFKKRADWLFSYLGEYFLKQGSQITVDSVALLEFIRIYDFHKERLPKKAKKDALAVISHYLSADKPDKESFFQSVAHSIEISHSIEHGYLRWGERLNFIAKDKKLLNEFRSKDIICLQECTDPQDFLKILKEDSRKNYKMLVHKVKADTSDHCVIIYDADKMQLNEQTDLVKFSLDHDKKPCMLAIFSKIDGTIPRSFIVGSVHHPGGNQDELHEILEKAQILKESAGGGGSVFILGDYNHDQHFFDDTLDENVQGFKMKMPDKGTMAGPDYGNTNEAIDGVLTNRSEQVDVDVFELPPAEPIVCPIEIKTVLASTHSSHYSIETPRLG